MAEKKAKVATAIHMTLDCSGSMRDHIGPTRKATDKYIEALAWALTPSVVTVSKFNTAFETLINQRLVSELPKVDRDRYYARGGTALYRATISAIEDLEEIDADQKVVVVLTDGIDENSSGTLKKVAKLIAEKRAEGWLIIFMGATPTADQTAELMGIAPQHTVEYKGADVAKVMAEVAEMTLAFKALGDAAKVGFKKRKH